MSRDEAKAGFTLVEMLAVMTLVALVSSLALVMIPGSGRARLKSVVMDSMALLRRERVGAILTGRDHHVSLDVGRRTLVGDDGGKVTIPSDIAIDILGEDGSWAGRRAITSFHPDGASSGAVLRFSREKLEYEVRVGWYTGGVTVEAR
jgi:general secretion pathway protein H